MLQKIEIMHFEHGKLCVKNVELCAKLCANSNKKSLFLFILHTFRVLFLIKKGGDRKKRSSLIFVHILTEFYLT